MVKLLSKKRGKAACKQFVQKYVCVNVSADLPQEPSVCLSSGEQVKSSANPSCEMRICTKKQAPGIKSCVISCHSIAGKTGRFFSGTHKWANSNFFISIF